MSASVISHIFLFGECPELPFFDNLAQKARPERRYKNWGFSNPFFWKTDLRKETAIFGPKKPRPETSFLFQQPKHKNALEPLFLVF